MMICHLPEEDPRQDIEARQPELSKRKSRADILVIKCCKRLDELNESLEGNRMFAVICWYQPELL